MGRLQLNAASSRMSSDVGFVLAIPILGLNTVAGIIYIDSEAPGFFIEEGEMKCLVSMAQQFLDGLEETPVTPFNRIRNVPFAARNTEPTVVEELPNDVKDALELVEQVAPPKVSKPFQFNFDYTDFVPIQQ